MIPTTPGAEGSRRLCFAVLFTTVVAVTGILAGFQMAGGRIHSGPRLEVSETRPGSGVGDLV